MGSTFEEEKKGVKITENTTKWLEKNLNQKEFNLLIQALGSKTRPSELAQGNLEISKDRMNLLDVVYGRMNLHLKGNNAYLNSEDIKAIRKSMEMAEFKKKVPNLVTTKETYVATAQRGALTFKVEVTGKIEGNVSDVLTAITEGKANPEQLKEEGVKIYSVDVEGKEKEVAIEKALPLLKNAKFTDIRPKRE